MSEHLLEVKNLKVSFHTYAGEVQAVRGVSFKVNPGECMAIVGRVWFREDRDVQGCSRADCDPSGRN